MRGSIAFSGCTEKSCGRTNKSAILLAMSRHHKRSVENRNKVEKRHAQSERRRLYNRSIKSQTRTLVTRVRRPIAAGDLGTAETNLTAAISAIDKAASKGVIHRNAAARRKSRLMGQFARAQRAQAS